MTHAALPEVGCLFDYTTGTQEGTVPHRDKPARIYARHVQLRGKKLFSIFLRIYLKIKP
jgi:hypothetical protein